MHLSHMYDRGTQKESQGRPKRIHYTARSGAMVPLPGVKSASLPGNARGDGPRAGGAHSQRHARRVRRPSGAVRVRERLERNDRPNDQRESRVASRAESDSLVRYSDWALAGRPSRRGGLGGVSFFRGFCWVRVNGAVLSWCTFKRYRAVGELRHRALE